jgi:hypothetical protein
MPLWHRRRRRGRPPWRRWRWRCSRAMDRIIIVQSTLMIREWKNWT